VRSNVRMRPQDREQRAAVALEVQRAHEELARARQAIVQLTDDRQAAEDQMEVLSMQARGWACGGLGSGPQAEGQVEVTPVVLARTVVLL